MVEFDLGEAGVGGDLTESNFGCAAVTGDDGGSGT